MASWEQIRASIVKNYQEALLNKRVITAQSLKSAFFRNKKKEHSLCLLMEYHNIHMAEVLEHWTLKNYFTTEKYLKEFLKGSTAFLTWMFLESIISLSPNLKYF